MPASNGRPSPFVRTTLASVILGLSAVWAVPTPLYAQHSPWSLSGSVGYAILNLGQVEKDNASDVEGWNALGIPVGPLGSVKRSSFFSGRLAYRLTREIAFSFAVRDQSKEVSSSYEGAEASLSLQRGIGSTDALVGISYYPSAQPFFLEWYIELQVGLIFGRADAHAHGTQTVKSGGVPILMPLVETDATYKKTRTSVALCVGADVPILRPFFVHIEGAYRFASLGTLDGDIDRFGQHSKQPSITEFDYSGFLVSGGIGIEF